MGSSTAGTYPKVQTVNGRRILRFDGTNDQLLTGTALNTFADWADGTIVAAVHRGLSVKVPTLKTATQSVSGTTGDAQLDVSGTGTSSKWTTHNGSALTSSESNSQTWVTAVQVYSSPGSVRSRINGVETSGNAGGEGMNSLRLGCNSLGANFAGMDIAEIIVVSHAATGTELTNLEGYLNGIRNTLLGL